MSGTRIGGSKNTKKTQLVRSLRNRIRRLETAARCDQGQFITTGCSELDRLLPGGGLAAGTITEWLAPCTGSGAEILSLIAAIAACSSKGACSGGGALVVIDPEHRFYPPAAASWGAHLENTIVLRSNVRGSNLRSRQAKKELYWAIDQALRCSAVAAVWGSLDHISERWFRRFQLSAEESGAMGMFVRPVRIQGQPSWSEVQWLVGEGRDEERRAKSERQRAKEEAQQPSTLNIQPSTFDIHSSFSKYEVRSTNGGTKKHPSTSDIRHSTLDIHSLSPMNPPSPLEKGGADPSFARRIQLRLIRCRGGKSGAHVTVQIDFTTGKLQIVSKTHETHPMYLATQLANPTTRRRQQRA